MVIDSVKIGMFEVEIFFKIHKKRKPFCENCKKDLKNEKTISLAFITGQPNKIICNNCAELAIQNGAKDLKKEKDDQDNFRQGLIDLIIRLDPSYHFERKNSFDFYYLKDRPNEKLLEIIKELQEKAEFENLVKEDLINFIETPTEEYLKIDYNVYEYKDLKSHLQIEGFFKDSSRFDGLFKCGADYSQNEVTILVKIGNKFYEVLLEADLGSTKNIQGCNRYYWVEEISKVTYKEVSKPLPLDKELLTITLNLTQSQKEKLLAFLQEENIVYDRTI